MSHNPNEIRLLTDMANHPASEVLFHHRFPTSTENVQNACHPFSTKWEGFKHNYVMVHNGYLSNEFALQDAHEDLGIKYVSEQPNGQFNDSEALLYDLALYLEGHQTELNAKGAIAFVMIERDETGKAIKMHYGRNSSPLKMQFKAGKFMVLASEGKGTDVPANQLHTYDYATGLFTSTPLTIPGYVSTYTAKDYERWTHGDDYISPTGTKWHYDYNEQDWVANSLANAVDGLGEVTNRKGQMLLTDAGWKEFNQKGKPYEDNIVVSKADREERVKEYVENELYLAGNDIAVALMNVDIEVDEAKIEYACLRAECIAAEDAQDSNGYIEALNDMDFLDESIKVGELAIIQLTMMAEVDAEERAEALTGGK